MDILDIIKQEHREVAAMFDEAKNCEPGDRRLLELAANVELALSTHLKIEERLFYSRLTEAAEDDEERVDMYEAYTEHDVAKFLMQAARSGRKPDEKFKAELQVMGEAVKHHVDEEESTVFSIAKDVMDSEEREELGDKWMKAKQRALSTASSNGARKKSSSRKKKAPARATSGRKKSTAKKKTSRTRR